MNKKQMIIMVLVNALCASVIAGVMSTAITRRNQESQVPAAEEASIEATEATSTIAVTEETKTLTAAGAIDTTVAEASKTGTVTKSESNGNQEEYTDLRRLDQKFLTLDEDFRWPAVREDLGQVENEYRITLDNDKIKNASPGEIIREWSFGYSDKAEDRIVISVPRLYDCDVATNALKDYGVLEVFCYYITGGQYEPMVAHAELIIYDKSAFNNKQQFTIVTLPTGNYSSSAWTITSIPTLTYDYSSIDYSTVEDALSETVYVAADEYAYGLSNHWDNERYFGTTSFTENSINFGIGELSALLERAEQCNILGRKPASEYLNELGETYNAKTDEYESGVESFALTEFCNEISGPIGGDYTMEHGYNGFLYFYPKNRRSGVIAVKQDRIYIGISSRPLWDEQDMDVANDRLYIGTYFVDGSSEPELVEIDGSEYLTLTRDTLNQLLRLLVQANIDWSSINAGNLGLDG
ncbi:hypothetical protein IKF94_02705 [Candidatus Saccharibacteria bacterium]|nr:hypothetical protein [Candidatus Saccharibacteria bacterium]